MEESTPGRGYHMDPPPVEPPPAPEPKAEDSGYSQMTSAQKREIDTLHDELKLLESDAKVGRQLVDLLMPFLGEVPDSEGAVDVLKRLLDEVDVARTDVPAAEGSQDATEAPVNPRRKARPS